MNSNYEKSIYLKENYLFIYPIFQNLEQMRLRVIFWAKKSISNLYGIFSLSQKYCAQKVISIKCVISF